MPEQLLGRIIKHCSNEGDLVVDPFSGSATTVAVAKKLGRKYLAFDLSEEYVRRGRTRLESACLGDTLEGAPEPTISAPGTPKQQGRRQAPKQSRDQMEGSPSLTPQQVKLFHNGLKEAFRQTYDGFSLDRVVVDPEMNAKFGETCGHLGLPGEPRTWNWTLFRLRKSGLFADLRTTRRTEFSWEDCDHYLFASEIAWRQMIDQDHESLDNILCDPTLAAEFDEIARRWSPGFSSLEYRWGALKLRKCAKSVRSRAKLIADGRLGHKVQLDTASVRKMPDSAGVYVVSVDDKTALYAGEASNLRDRLSRQFRRNTRPLWQKKPSECLSARFFSTQCSYSTRLAYQRRLVLSHQPRLNLSDQVAV